MKNLNLKLAKIDEEELLQIWDNFTDLIIDDKEDEGNEEIIIFFNNLIYELSTGEEVYISNANKTVEDIMNLFISSFQQKGRRYYFHFRNIFAEGVILK